MFYIIKFEKIDEVFMKKIADKISENLFEGCIILLKGDLGAGKTTITKMIVSQFNNKDNISSPTFAITKIYHTEKFIFHHIDLYRIADPSEIEYIDIFNDKDGIYFIEWAEFLDYLTPDDKLEIKLEYNKDISFRNIIITGTGKKYEELEKNLYNLN